MEILKGAGIVEEIATTSLRIFFNRLVTETTKI